MEAKKMKLENSSTITLIMVEQMNIRKYPDGTEYGMSNAITSGNKFGLIQKLIIPQELMQKIETNKAYMATKFSLLTDKTVKLSSNSLLFNTKHPEIDVGLIEMFIKPRPAISVREVLIKMSNGERISVDGYISKVSDLLQSPLSKRKILTLRGEDGSIVDVKLWGPKSETKCTESKTDLCRISCVEVSIYNNKVSLNSTVNTNIEVIEDEKEFHGSIDGATFDLNGSYIIIGTEILSVQYDLLCNIFEETVFEPDVMVMGIAKGSNIIKMERISDEQLLS